MIYYVDSVFDTHYKLVYAQANTDDILINASPQALFRNGL